MTQEPEFFVKVWLRGQPGEEYWGDFADEEERDAFLEDLEAAQEGHYILLESSKERVYTYLRAGDVQVIKLSPFGGRR